MKADSPRSRAGLLGVRGVILGVWLLILAAMFFGVYANRPLAFDNVLWKTEPALRPRMVEDLISSKLLIGLNKPELTALLGPAQEEASSDNSDEVWYHYQKARLKVTFQAGKVTTARSVGVSD